MDLEHLHTIVNAWFAEQKELPGNTRVDITISLTSFKAEVSATGVVKPDMGMLVKDFFTYERFSERIVTAMKHYLFYGDRNPGLKYETLTMEQFCTQFPAHEIWVMPNIGKKSLREIMEKMDLAGYPRLDGMTRYV